LITPVDGQVAGALVESLRNETIVRSGAALEAFPIRPRGLEGAVTRALSNEDLDFAQTRWSDALAAARPVGIAPTRFGRRLVRSSVVRMEAATADVWRSLGGLGGRGDGDAGARPG
jgi:hypothetical protein